MKPTEILGSILIAVAWTAVILFVSIGYEACIDLITIKP